MGRQTQLKLLKQQEVETNIKESLIRGSKKFDYCVKFDILKKFPVDDYRCQFVKDISKFKLKTKSSSHEKQLLELVKFLFGKYQSPKILEQSWYTLVDSRIPKTYNIDGTYYDFRDWYICVTAGGSLYKQYAKNLLSKKELHSFLSCPFELTIPQAIYYCIIKSICNNDGVALRIARSKLCEKPFNEFWRNCARFFANNPPTSINDVNDLIDYINAKKTENRRYELYGSGYTLNALLKKMHDWHADLRRMKAIGNSDWDGHPIEDQIIKSKLMDKDVVWKFTQLKSSKQLAAEGNAMRHCVFGYKSSCVSGDISIWSLTVANSESADPKRCITIELRNNGRIAQCRGLANRSCKSEEKHIIAKWATMNGLDFSSYY